MDKIDIRGARTHNLKNINLILPRNKLIVITGLSGSGKSSLAFDTLYAEGQRRYVESLSSYARQFLSLMEKPDVDHIEGLSPAISIEQKTTSHNPRSTVGTVTELYDYLRLLFARAGEPRCPDHDLPLEAQTISQMIEHIFSLGEGSKILLLAPVIRDRKGEHLQLLEKLRNQGYVRVRIDGELYELDDTPKLDGKRKHTIEVVVDRIVIREDIRSRLADSLETATQLSDGLVLIAQVSDDKKAKNKEILFSAKFSCTECGYNLTELEPRIFSFNNPAGACPECDGLGEKQFFSVDRIVDKNLSIANGAIRGWDRRNFYYYSMLTSLAKHYKFSVEDEFKSLTKSIQNIILHGSKDIITFKYTNDKGETRTKKDLFEGVVNNLQRRYMETESDFIRDELAKYLAHQPCPGCEGTRLRKEARFVFVGKKTLPELCQYAIGDILSFFQKLNLKGVKAQIAEKILKEICQRLQFLIDVGLDYLSLNRTAETLSGGEAQRIRLASQIGAGLVGVMYILDEPSIGLHQRDNERLLKTLKHLRDIGNTVIVVEHDEDAIMQADHVVDIGPGAGAHGGQVIAEGTPKQILAHPKSLTGKYLSHKLSITIPKKRTPVDPKKLVKLIGASGNNLKNLTIDFPIGLFTCVTGVSGSGKSTLINDTLYPLAAIELNRAEILRPYPHKDIKGLDQLDKVVGIDQSPIGRTPRSNAATYTGLFSHIRDIFAATTEARTRGYKVGRFSFNVKGGRCEACQGDGLIKVEMHFLADVYVTCDVCKGKRYNDETLQVHYKDKNIHEVLSMTVEDACTFFSAIPPIARKLKTLVDVGLGYLQIGQSATTLSGGEAQRVKLSKELSRRDTGQTLYILDEPTTGLHFHDVKQLLDVLHHLKDKGNTIIVIEHNLDVIKTADWVIDLGPEGGHKGGKCLIAGTPEQVAAHPESYTGKFLKPILQKAKK